MCGQSLVYFGSSVIYINGVHIHNRQDYYCAGAIISFKFSFHANVVSNIADIMINIEIIINIADRGKKRCRIRTPEGLWMTRIIQNQSCGYCCGYVIILWIVDAILFQAECPKFC